MNFSINQAFKPIQLSQHQYHWSLSALSLVLYKVWYTQNQIVSCLRWGTTFLETKQHDHPIIKTKHYQLWQQDQNSCLTCLNLWILFFIDLSLIMFVCYSRMSLSDLEWSGWLMILFVFIFLFARCFIIFWGKYVLGVCVGTFTL